MKKKLAILYDPIHYVLDVENSGSEFSWAFQIYQHLSRHERINPIYVTGGEHGIYDKKVHNVNTMNPKKLNLSFINIIRFYLSVFTEGINILQKERIDIIHHVLPFYIGRTFNLLPFFYHKPFVIGPIQSPLSIQDEDLNTRDARGFSKKEASNVTRIENGMMSIIMPIVSLLSYFTLKRANRLIVINDNTKHLLLQKGIKESKICVMPPGINIEMIPFNSLTINESVTNIISVGYLLKRKRVDLIIKAISKVIKKNKNICLHIVGDGPEKGILEKLTNDLGITDYVVFHGFIPQSKIAMFYQKASIFVNMSKAEGFATVCLEAMASGLAIISSRVGGFSDAIKEGYSGYLVDQGDYELLAQRIVYLLENKEKMKEMGRNARLDIRNLYDWKRVIIPKYIKVYESLV